VAKEVSNKDLAVKSVRKRLRRAYQQLNRAMAMMEEVKREISAMIEGAQSICRRVKGSTDDDSVG
jgi:tRNA nucleotidyltransferase (CCA-adding enzyme)